MSGPLFDRFHGARAAAQRSRLDGMTFTPVGHADRSSTFPLRLPPPVTLHVDGDRALPLLAIDLDGRPRARFRHLADLAWFLDPAGPAPTLPYPIVVAARREANEQRELL